MLRFFRIFKNHLELSSRIMSWSDALRVTWLARRPGEFRFRLVPGGREVFLRGVTTDFECLKKVLIDREYETPFPVEPSLIVDAGANTGFATLYFAARYPAAKIVAIEPEASNFAMLEKNCRGLSQVTLIQAALWGSETTVAILDPEGAKCGFEVGAEGVVGAQAIPTVTISGILKQMGAERIDILKIDIEGAERELFEEKAETWLGSVGQIAVELHDWKRPGCAWAIYSALVRYLNPVGKHFEQVRVGENLFLRF